MYLFITEAERGNGYGVALMEYVMKYPKLKAVKNWKLATNDANGLYEKFGFRILEQREKIMER